MIMLNDIRHIKELGLDWIDIPKCGSSTIRKALSDNKMYHRVVHRDIANASKIKGFAMLREPIDRLQSLYCMWRYGRGAQYGADKSFDEWVRDWLGPSENWRLKTVFIPQTEFLRIDGVELDVRLFAWNFKELFDFMGINSYGHENKSSRSDIKISPETADLIDKVYTEDFKLWRETKNQIA